MDGLLNNEKFSKWMNTRYLVNVVASKIRDSERVESNEKKVEIVVENNYINIR